MKARMLRDGLKEIDHVARGLAAFLAAMVELRTVSWSHVSDSSLNDIVVAYAESVVPMTVVTMPLNQVAHSVNGS